MQIAERMKDNYESRQRYRLTRRTPVIVRVDGRAFHTYTRGMERPFDMHIVQGMTYAARCVAEDMQGFKVGYIQSDEASFLMTDYDRLDTQAWFDYNQSKIETMAASIMTAHFNEYMDTMTGVRPDRVEQLPRAYFDARAFNIPREEVTNYFLWRAKDWQRNSVAMYCGAFFSRKQMHGKGRADQHEMLYSIGKNWATDLEERLRNGTFLVNTPAGITARHDVLPVYNEIDLLVSPCVFPSDLVET